MTRAQAFHFGGVMIDPIAFASQGNAILGIRDSGKTYTAMELAENLYEASIPFTAFDPIGIWRFLRAPGPGKGGRGYPVVVAGGAEGDLPLTPESAPAIVEAAMRSGVSLVIDLFDINLSKTQWRAIVRDSVKALLHGNRDHGLRHVFLEEAAEFIPQKPTDWLVYAELEKLARMGGNCGLGFTLINQRSQEVAKAILELCDNVFLHRQRGKNALENLDKWLLAAGEAERKAIMASLPDMPQGDCWAWLGGDDPKPPQLIHVPPKRSLHPDRRQLHGANAVRPTLPAAEVADISRFVARMKLELHAAETAAAEAVRTQLAKPPAPISAEQKAELGWFTQSDIEAAERRGYELGQAEAAAKFAEGLRTLASGAELLKAATADLRADIEELASQPTRPAVAPYRSPRVAREAEGLPALDVVLAPAPASDEADRPRASRAALTPTQLTLLKSLRWWRAMGHPAVSRRQLAAIAGLKNGSSHLRGRLAELSAAGLVEYPSPGDVALTPAGADAAPAPDMQHTLVDSIRAILTPTQLQLFEVLRGRREGISRDDLADAAALTPGSSHLRARLAELSAHELVEYPKPGFVRLQDWVVEPQGGRA
ncbi:MAG TPA: hypothetical protein VGG29_20740 [Caulobacteraceae bacterium]